MYYFKGSIIIFATISSSVAATIFRENLNWIANSIALHNFFNFAKIYENMAHFSPIFEWLKGFRVGNKEILGI